MKWLSGLPFSSGGFNDIADAKCLASSLMVWFTV